MEVTSLRQLLDDLAELRDRAIRASSDTRQLTADFQLICAWWRRCPIAPVCHEMTRRALR
jgi:hypothetical protein